jgi:hypothetical protein
VIHWRLFLHVLRAHLRLTLLAPTEPCVLELSLYLLHPHARHLIYLALIRKPLHDLCIQALGLSRLRILLLSSLRVLHGHFDLLPVVLGGVCLLHSA